MKRMYYGTVRRVVIETIEVEALAADDDEAFDKLEVAALCHNCTEWTRREDQPQITIEGVRDGLD